MPLEPILLGAPLSAILHLVFEALGTSVERNELLVKLAVFFTVRVLLILHQMLQWALVISALANVDEFIRRWLDGHVFFARLRAFFLLLPGTGTLRFR